VSQRFLIVRLGSLGDVIHGIPVAAALRAARPDAQIDWLVDPRYVEVLNLVSVLSRPIGVNPRGSRSILLRVIGDLRRTRYDAALDLQGLIKSAVLARAAGAAQTIGLTRAHLRESAASLFYSRRVDPDARHVVYKNLALLEALGISCHEAEFPLRIPRSAVADAVSARCGDDGYMLLNPGAAWPNKRWPPDRFGDLAAAIRDATGMRSIVLWGPGEQSLAEAVVSASRGSAELSPQTTVSDLFALASRARAVVAGDTGPLHIAAAVGAPVVALFGPTFPERNGPWLPTDISISRAHTCVCHHKRQCLRPPACIQDIAVEEVVEAVRRRLRVDG
jgi:lipopolysaccharide heptosyltransferase I